MLIIYCAIMYIYIYMGRRRGGIRGKDGSNGMHEVWGNDRTSELGCAVISNVCGGREMKAAKEKRGVRMGGWE